MVDKGSESGNQEKENWLKSENKFKRYSSRGVVGVAGTAIIAGAIRGLALLGKGVVEKAGGPVIDSGEPMTTTKDLSESDVKYSVDYQTYGLNYSKIAINLTNPTVVDRKLMQILSAETGGPGWILPVVEKDGKDIIPENADFLAEQLVAQLTGTSKQEVLDNWIVWHNDQQAFLNFLQTHGANSTVVNFWQCTLNLTQNDQTKDTWMDRVPAVQVCAVKAKTSVIPQSASMAQSREGEEGKDWKQVTEIFNQPGLADAAQELAERIGIDAQDLMGAIAGVVVDWQNHPGVIAQQLSAVEAVAQIYPEERLELYAGFAAQNVNFLEVCGLVALVVAGRASQRIQSIRFPNINFQDPFDKLISQLSGAGQKIMDNLYKNSQEFRNWTEELRSKNNARKLVRRLENGLNLSRNSEIALETILNAADNQDLRDLVLTEGPNWFRHVPENHPEIVQIMRFFGCRDYSELKALADQPERVVNRLYQVLVGRGKKADLRKTEQVRGLIDLYKKASRFSGEGRR